MMNVLIFIERLFMQTAVSSAKMAVIVLILLCLTIPVTSRYRAGWRYYSWLAVMLVFMVPFSMLGLTYSAEIPAIQDAAVTAGEWVSGHAPAYEVTEVVKLPTVSDESPTGRAMEPVEYTYRKPINVKRILSLIWAAAAMIFFAVHIRRYTVFRRALKRHVEAVTDENILAALEAEKRDMGIKAKIPICKSSVITSPMLTGFFKPLLLFPEQELSERELHLVLRHELTHYKRRDIWYQFILLVFLSLHWFNPVAYIMAKAIEIDGETSCDERVLENCPYETRVFYGEMLIDFLRKNNQKRSYLTTTFFGGKKGMKKRLNLIASEKLRKRGTAAMSALIAFAVTAAVCAAAAQPWDEEMMRLFNDPTEEQMQLVDVNVTRPLASAENNGTTVEIKQTITDNHQLYILFEVTAPEGTVIPENAMWDFFTLDWNSAGNATGGIDVLKADGNKATMLFSEQCNGFVSKQQKIKLMLKDLVAPNDENYREPHMIAEGTFNFELTSEYTNLSKAFLPDKICTAPDGSKYTIECVEVSSMSVYVAIEAGAKEPGGARSAVPEPVVHMNDGTEYTLIFANTGNYNANYAGRSGDRGAYFFGMRFNTIENIENIKDITIGDTVIPISGALESAAELPIVSDWARGTVDRVSAETKYMRSMSGMYDYTKNITRLQFCEMAYYALWEIGMPCTDYSYRFTDTSDNRVSGLYAAGIISGKTETEFAPFDHLTREEAAAILYRIADYAHKPLLAKSSAPKYADENEISDWAKDAVSALGAAEIMSGDGVNFNPKDGYTIEQAIITLSEVLGL